MTLRQDTHLWITMDVAPRTWPVVIRKNDAVCIQNNHPNNMWTCPCKKSYSVNICAPPQYRHCPFCMTHHGAHAYAPHPLCGNWRTTLRKAPLLAHVLSRVLSRQNSLPLDCGPAEMWSIPTDSSLQPESCPQQSQSTPHDSNEARYSHGQWQVRAPWHCALPQFESASFVIENESRDLYWGKSRAIKFIKTWYAQKQCKSILDGPSKLVRTKHRNTNKTNTTWSCAKDQSWRIKSPEQDLKYLYWAIKNILLPSILTNWGLIGSLNSMLPPPMGGGVRITFSIFSEITIMTILL